MVGLTIIAGDSCMEQLSRCLESICERTQDFTDSAYISHDHRQNIILLCERAKLELGHLLLKYNNAEAAKTSDLLGQGPHSATAAVSQACDKIEVDQCMRSLMKTTTELRLELQQTSLELASSLIHNARALQVRGVC